MMAPIIADGNCLFRCIAQCVYGDQEMHKLARYSVTHYAKDIVKKPNWESQWAVIKPTYWDLQQITGDTKGDFTQYTEKQKVELWATHMAKLGVYGDVNCLFLAADLYNADFHIKITGKFKHLSPMHIKSWHSNSLREHKTFYFNLDTHVSDALDHYTVDSHHSCESNCVGFE